MQTIEPYDTYQTCKEMLAAILRQIIFMNFAISSIAHVGHRIVITVATFKVAETEFQVAHF